MKPQPLEELYAKLAPADAHQPTAAVMQREIGHFNVFSIADLMLANRGKPSMTFDRRAYYKISLICGRGQVEYADRVVDIQRRALWFVTPRVPYRWLPLEPEQTGYFCIFTDEFLRPVKGGAALEELPVFRPGNCPVLVVAEADYAAAAAIFQKMTREITSAYAYKYDLLRAYLLELIHLGQKLQPAPALAPAHTAAARLAGQFTELLERQFPLDTPRQQLRLRTARDYADQLAVHVNHLNRVLKEATGSTTTALIGDRVAQEARILLKQTSWTISEIAASLGFADAAHFGNFFKRQTTLTPREFRG